MLSAGFLRQALLIWMEYGNSLGGTPSIVESFRDVSSGYELVVNANSSFNAIKRFETEELLVQGTRRVRDIKGVTPVIGKISLSYPEPPHRLLYEKFCKAPIELDAGQTVFRFISPELDAPLQNGNEGLFSVCAQHCRDVMRADPEAGLMRSRLRTLFLTRPDRLPDLDAAGASLGISVSTLRRQLEVSGQRYQALKDEFRFDLAREYLRSGQMTPKQVGYLLGFSSPSVFSRAFKTWSGRTIGEFVRSGDTL